ncbi:MAG: DUF4276 family protein, partial [Chitinispirillaceae bacterium]|nr:DUF4276 family protein [Chitinispirillaceae bacterium]
SYPTLYTRDMIKGGNSYLNDLKKINEASRMIPHIILTDLDNSPCVPTFVNKWINFTLNDNLLFRVAVKEIDAWLIADREAFSEFIGIPLAKIPSDTQTILDPKEFIIQMAKKSKKKHIKDIIPVGSAKQGPGYNSILTKFITQVWCPYRASKHNESLNKSIKKIENFIKTKKLE